MLASVNAPAIAFLDKKGSECPTQDIVGSGYAIFDFDRTIVAIDTGSTSLRLEHV